MTHTHVVHKLLPSFVFLFSPSIAFRRAYILTGYLPPIVTLTMDFRRFNELYFSAISLHRRVDGLIAVSTNIPLVIVLSGVQVTHIDPNPPPTVIDDPYIIIPCDIHLSVLPVACCIYNDSLARHRLLRVRLTRT
ncbi:hypothetical protein LXA43DRAFT_1007293 [Ganoderma leucocontextum]|nr:hypothetical protein LXA43DRAFT_1007293 [Ganoderma leucocontextum]